jgi:hypothetical protein
MHPQLNNKTTIPKPGLIYYLIYSIDLYRAVSKHMDLYKRIPSLLYPSNSLDLKELNLLQHLYSKAIQNLRTLRSAPIATPP